MNIGSLLGSDKPFYALGGDGKEDFTPIGKHGLSSLQDVNNHICIH